MPCREASATDQRTQFIADHLRGVLATTELCALYGISRKTAYKWIDRYLRHGPAGLEEGSRRPRRSPNQTSDEIVSAILDARRRHPRGGGKKLLALLRKRPPRWSLPGRSTACDILSRHGMVPVQRRRRRLGHPGKRTTQVLAPNDVWSTDYKGQFRTGDGRSCYPLTVADGFSRYLLGCQALTSTAGDEARPIFTLLFQEYGLPKRMRSDNGVPFATTTLARLSTLSAWWIRLGILPELIEPGRPDQNGRHERMHRTLKAETTRPAAGNLAAQQHRFNVFPQEFNHERPHEALDQETPATCYAPSPRPMPDRLPPLEYPDRFEVWYVSANGGIRWNSRWVNVSTVCVGEYVGLEEIDDGIWSVYFGPVRLGRLSERHMRIEARTGSFIVEMCNPCPRTVLLPMSPTAHSGYGPVRHASPGSVSVSFWRDERRETTARLRWAEKPGEDEPDHQGQHDKHHKQHH